LTASQIAEWEAYNTIDPIGGDRDDYRFALLGSFIANLFRDPKKGEFYSPLDIMNDFMDWGKVKRKIIKNKAKFQSLEQMRQVIDSMKILFKRKKIKSRKEVFSKLRRKREE